MPRRTFFHSILVLCLLYGRSGAEGWQFHMGDSHRYVATQHLEQTITLGPAGNVVTQAHQTLGFTLHVDAVADDGAASIIQQFTRIQIKLVSPGSPETILDTESIESPSGFASLMMPLLEALTREPIRLKMSPRGKVFDIEIPAAVVRAIANAPAGPVLGELNSEAGLKQMLQAAAFELPAEEKLEPGYEWTVSSSQSNLQTGPIYATTTYRYNEERIEGDAQLAVFTRSIATHFGEPTKPGMSPIEVVSEESSGEVEFNRTAGWLESSTFDHQLTTHVKVGQQDVEQTLHQQTTLKRQE